MNIAVRAATTTQPTPVNTYGLTRADLIHHFRAAPETVDGWLSGERRRPPYFDMALRAARQGLHPIAKPLMVRYGKELGVPEAQLNYWMKTDQVPVPARLAVAWIIHRRVTGRE